MHIFASAKYEFVFLVIEFMIDDEYHPLNEKWQQKSVTACHTFRYQIIRYYSMFHNNMGMKLWYVQP